MTITHLPPLTSPYPVSGADLASYRRDGHVRLRAVATAGEVSDFREVIAAGVRRLSTEDTPIDERDTYGRAFLQVVNLWRHDPAAAQFSLASRFAGVAAALLGVERVRLYHDQALFKEPQGGHTPWHQDAMYWPLDGHRCITMWMPLVDVSPEAGGMCFASGSHTAGPLSDVVISDASEEHFERLVSDRRFPIAAPIPMAAGDATFHSGWTVHKALPNASTSMREVMTVIWFADGLTVTPPANPAQANDLATWLPGARPGDVAATELNPLLPMTG
ncbi:phytanoyl-CoA dioxygenase family protein [Micromonospora sp. GCM10011542]|uniref:phytanoyl-CoA dioxygenase family protein n=1 Tax=Micromonospora sp. GCM10011542 TaxID=3317337 RepID=UPI00361E1927